MIAAKKKKKECIKEENLLKTVENVLRHKLRERKYKPRVGWNENIIGNFQKKIKILKLEVEGNLMNWLNG